MKTEGGAHLEKFLQTGVAKDYAGPSDDVTRDQTKTFIADSKKYFPVSNFITYIIN